MHTIELFKRTEAQVGTTQFLGFDFGKGHLVEPPPRRTRKIEVIGDSAAAGFGIEGLGYTNNDCPGVDFAAHWENFRKSFGSVLADTLDAELHGTVYSGKGLAKNIWRDDPDTMPMLFSLANPVDEQSEYDFSWEPDVVIVMIGGNDFAEGQPNEDDDKGPATVDEFTAAYRSFVSTVRGHYPDAHIVLSVSPSVSDLEPKDRNTRTNVTNATLTVARERSDAGDTKVYAFAPTPATSEELIACDGHGTPEFHARVAAEYAPFVRDKTGW
jgi:lysophospholipase L1-like esterase